jgi:oligoribonuclease NrnB/cAMP/cGMP phosphodiesterase (DHH superfamily)
MEKILKDIVVVYHADCTDGFGAAYAAWKKFGDTATYIPLKTQVEIDIDFSDKEVYVVDYSFNAEVDARVRTEAKSLVVIDHHQTAKDVVTAHPQNIFDQSHSGAVLAWQYFHPDTTVPELLLYVEDHDVWKFVLPDNLEFNAALGQYERSFLAWDELVTNLANPEFRASFIETGRTIKDFEESLIKDLLKYKERARFEGHDIWVLNVSRVYRSILGHKLAKLNESEGGIPLSIVYCRSNGAINLSLRSEGDIDVAAIAQKYGGGGHKHAAGIKVADFKDLPFEFI